MFRQAAALLLLVVMACTSSRGPRTPGSALVDAGGHSPQYEVQVLEPGSEQTRPVTVTKQEYQRALVRLLRDVRVEVPPQQAAGELLGVGGALQLEGHWVAEVYRGQVYSLVPEEETLLVPEQAMALTGQYLGWCQHRGGGDCLQLLVDGPYLKADDRRALALALAFGGVLDETWQALEREALSPRAVVSMLVWAVGLYFALWLVPELATKGVAAALTLILVGWLGVDTLWGLFNGWMELANSAHEASTLAQLREAADKYSKVVGEDAARALIMAVATLTGRTLGEIAARVRGLPGYGAATAQWEAQGAAAVVAEGPAAAVAAEPTVAAVQARAESAAIDKALKEGRHWLARLLEREARGRFVEKTFRDQFKHLKWNHQGIDVLDPVTGNRYEILSGTASNLARHGRRMSTELFRMITF